MRASRVFRLIFRIFISLLTLSVTLVSILGGMSAVLILSNPDNIGIDVANGDFNLDVNYTTGVINDINFTLPFNITNAGYFNIENFYVQIELAMNYSEVDYPVPGVNGSRIVKIFEKGVSYGTILKSTTRDFNFTGIKSEFIIANFPNITSEVDIFKTPPIMQFYVNFTISLDYSLGMHSLTAFFTDIKVGELP